MSCVSLLWRPLFGGVRGNCPIFPVVNPAQGSPFAVNNQVLRGHIVFCCLARGSEPRVQRKYTRCRFACRSSCRFVCKFCLQTCIQSPHATSRKSAQGVSAPNVCMLTSRGSKQPHNYKHVFTYAVCGCFYCVIPTYSLKMTINLKCRAVSRTSFLTQLCLLSELFGRKRRSCILIIKPLTLEDCHLNFNKSNKIIFD